jgi:hypothetical protein
MRPSIQQTQLVIKIQSQLAQDSLKGMDEHAHAIVKAVRGGTVKMLPSSVADQADKLAKAKDLPAAREAFKPLSISLISDHANETCMK